MPPVQPISISAGCTRNCSGQRITGRPGCRLISVGLNGEAGEVIIGLEDFRSEITWLPFLQADLAPAAMFV